MASTLQDVQQAVRELSFDRFPVPVFTLKAKAGYSVTNNATEFTVKQGINPVLSAPYGTYDTQQKLVDFLVEQGYPLALLGYFSGSNPNTELTNFTTALMDNNLMILRKNYYSDDTINQLIIQYCIQVLGFNGETAPYTNPPPPTVSDLPSVIAAQKDVVIQHMILWCAINEVDQRRINDYGAAIMKGYFTDGSGAVMAGALNTGNIFNQGGHITVDIGSVFNMTDETTPQGMWTGGGANSTLAGADNVLEDWSSFWWKLFVWLRDKIEQKYGDYGFRKDMGMWSHATLDKPLNWRVYFDSYPFTLSPLPRYIVS